MVSGPIVDSYEIMVQLINRPCTHSRQQLGTGDISPVTELETIFQNIVVLTGAGISVSAGIPDFRSPGIGLYDNL